MVEIEPLIINDDGDVNDQDNENQQEENPEVEEMGYQKKKRKRSSKVWDHMTEVTVGGKDSVQCNHCKEIFKKEDTGTTTHLKRHLDNNCIQMKMANKKKQQVLSFTELTEDGNTSITNFAYDHSKVRELASHMLLVHEYPFLMMDHVIFNKFCKAISPFYVKITRHTVKKDCWTTYEKEKNKLKIALKGVSRISITTDLWKSDQNVQYMVVTGHFVESWLLQKRVLNFYNVPPPHTGVIVADALSKCFSEWGIDNKVSTITVDNAAYNDVCVKRIKDDFLFRKTLSIGGELFHVRCCAHILNLLVKDGLDQIGSVISDVREGVKYLRSSESRLNKFSKIKNQLHLPSKKLVLDCLTRWNGTYLMLASTLQVRDVFRRYADIDPGFKYVPTEYEWEKVDCQFFGVFNEITKIISGSNYPTSNLFLKSLLNEKALDSSENIRKMAACMEEKFDKYWGESNLLLSLAAIFYPRYKMALIKDAFKVIYGVYAAPRKKLNALYDEYVVEYTSSNNEGNVGRQLKQVGKGTDNSLGPQVTKKTVLTSKEKFQMSMSEDDTAPPEKKNQNCLSIWKRIGIDVMHMKILMFWLGGKGNNQDIKSYQGWPVIFYQFQLLTFSAGGRVIDDRRASMSVETVQMLLCAGDWVRNVHGLKTHALDHQEEERL